MSPKDMAKPLVLKRLVSLKGKVMRSFHEKIALAPTEFSAVLLLLSKDGGRIVVRLGHTRERIFVARQAIIVQKFFSY